MNSSHLQPLFLFFTLCLSTIAFEAYNLMHISLFCISFMLLIFLHKRATFSNHGIILLYSLNKMRMAVQSGARLGGRLVNEILSFLVFSVLDVVDAILCYIYKVLDFLIEAEWKECYCSSPVKEITVSEAGESKILRLTCRKLQLEEISDTLYTRPSLVSKSTAAIRSSSLTVNSTIMDMLQGRIGGQRTLPIPRWSDCNCKTCTSWTASSCRDTLFVKVDGARENAGEDVIFIHGFISSSAFWSETLYPNFSKSAKSKYRLFAVDLLGFGRSPKPMDSLYTLREHLEMIQRSVLEPYNVKSFHIVAHSLGCILALALAVSHPSAVKSLTLLAPVPIFPNAERGGGDAAHDEEGGAAARVACDRLWGVDGVLVRAH
ncbi:hypothetical protein SASPL_133013 [Salvia splendens]|uniref:AB hydrolase-1 domain-containing protein n=1 Tax=Salvia splendens TaxID=180675 RepID=A0A8X8X3A9_SALSN|nr:hypothetical protein SASPL_133013 [Salvia splendens]